MENNESKKFLLKSYVLLFDYIINLEDFDIDKILLDKNYMKIF